MRRHIWQRALRGVASLVPVEGELFEAPTVEGYYSRFKIHPERQFKAVTYNILAPCYALHPEVGSCPREVLEWEFRKRRILAQIQSWDADVICLQEVERVIFEKELEPWFMERGYEGIYFCKQPEVDEGLEEGVALMYKSSSFVRVSSVCAPFREFFEPIGHGLFFHHVRSLRDGFAMALLHHLPSRQEVLVAGVHLYGQQMWPDARIAQIHVLCETIHTYLRRQSRPRHTPIVLLGDFASFWKKWTTDKYDKWVEDRCIVSGVYSLLTEGLLDVTHCHHPFVRNHQGSIQSTGIKALQFTTSNFLFESAHYRAHGAEPLITKCTHLHKGPADYIFYTPGSLDTVSTLQLPYADHPSTRSHHIKLLPMPNAHFPSNHLPIGATLAIK